MWGAVDRIVKNDAFFATNTSSLSVADQAAATGRPERFLGLHFFNPPQVMPLLEVVKAEGTSDEAYDLGFALGEQLRKTSVAAGDNRGFIVNRLLVPYMLDAMRGYEQGIGSIEDIDRGMMAGASHPMGPLTLADFVGLDTLASIADVMVDFYGEDRFAQPDTLRKLVEAGHYGRKSGRGSTTTRVRSPSQSSPVLSGRLCDLGTLDVVRVVEASDVQEPSIERIRNATFLADRPRL